MANCKIKLSSWKWRMVVFFSHPLRS